MPTGFVIKDCWERFDFQEITPEPMRRTEKVSIQTGIFMETMPYKEANTV